MPYLSWFGIKLCLLSLPFMLAGALLAPVCPTLKLDITLAISTGTIVLGFLYMVLGDEDSDSTWQKIVSLIVKTVFFGLMLFSIGLLLHMGVYGGPYRIITIPLCLIAAKIFFKINVTEFLG